MKMVFYTPCHGVEESGFGAATFGFVRAEDERADCVRTYPLEMDGDVYTGRYEQILRQISPKHWQAGIVLFGNAGGENDFIQALSARTRCPLTGGAAAIDPVSGKSGLISGHGEASVFLIQDGRYDVRVCSKNIHENEMGTHQLTFRSPRELTAVDGQDAISWFSEQKRALGLPEDDFEHLTFADLSGVNAHLSRGADCLLSGRDLQEHMVLRYLPPQQVLPQMQAFYDDADAIVFGCAGLKKILPAPLQAKGMGLFMFGEVCTMNQHSEFGNLMLSKLIIKKR
jgi:hypothetical protein